MARKAKPINEKVGEALEAAKAAAAGGHVFRTKTLARTRVDLLKKGGWLLEIHGGWYALMHPNGRNGDTVPFFSNYWEFIRKYLGERLGKDYALSAAASLAIHSDSYAIPRQLSVQTTRSTQGIIALPFNLTLAIYTDVRLDMTGVTETAEGLRLLSLERALASIPAASFRLPTPELVAAVATVRNISELTRLLLSAQASTAAGRLTEALRGAGRDADAKIIETAFQAAGLTIGNAGGVTGTSFATLAHRPKSTIAARLTHIWQTMSEQISSPPARASTNPDAFRKKGFQEIRAKIKEVYANDAYNSLSIEGYQVTPELIRRVASGDWDPKRHEQDKQAIDALAARGYYEAFNAVLKTIERLHVGANAVATLERDFLDWRAYLFSPAAKAGLLPLDSLAGYRHNPVYIRNSMHVPPPHEKLMDAIDTLFACLREEPDPWKQAVLAHYVFVNIHPFPDGNGRIGRFLMNVLLVAGGYEWTIVRMSQRNVYFAALEKASMEGTITQLSDFLADEMAASSIVELQK